MTKSYTKLTTSRYRFIISIILILIYNVSFYKLVCPTAVGIQLLLFYKTRSNQLFLQTF